MLKPTYIFIQQHNFIDFENKIFFDYTYQSCKWSKIIPTKIECTIYTCKPS